MIALWHNTLFWLLALAACGSAIAVVVTQNIVRMAFWLLISLAAVSGLFFLLGADFVGAAQLMVYVGGTLVLLIFGVMLTASGPFVSLQTGARDWVIAALLGPALVWLIAGSIASPGVEWAGVVRKSLTVADGQTQRIRIGLEGADLKALHLSSNVTVTVQVAATAGQGEAVALQGGIPLTWASDPPATSTSLGLALLGIRANRPRQAPSARAESPAEEHDPLHTLRTANLSHLSVTNHSGSAAQVDFFFSSHRRALRPGEKEAAKPQAAGYLLPFEIASVHLLVVLIGAAYLARAKRRVGSDVGEVL